jgi:hypothetical protein
MVEQTTPDVLGDSLIPVINKLQDIFNQVWRLSELRKRHAGPCSCIYMGFPIG